MSLQAINFDLKITPGSIPPVLHMSQYDSGRQYTAYLKDEENTAFIPGAGATAKLKGFNAAGVPWEQAATVDGSTVVFTPSGAATDQFGIMPVTIEITVGSEKLTPLLMIFNIQRAGYTNEEAVRSPEFETAMEAAAAEALAEVGVLLAEDQATKTAAMTQPVGVDSDGKMWTTPGGGGLSDDAKQLLLACFAHVAWADEHGQDYYDALEDALYPPADLVSITAVYLQDRPIYDTDDLDAIKASDDLTVTAHYSNGTSVVLDDEDYTLSGTLTVGTSIITVSYGGKTDTISVTVTESILPAGYVAVNYLENTSTSAIKLPVRLDSSVKNKINAKVYVDTDPSSGAGYGYTICGCGEAYDSSWGTFYQLYLYHSSSVPGRISEAMFPAGTNSKIDLYGDYYGSIVELESIIQPTSPRSSS